MTVRRRLVGTIVGISVLLVIPALYSVNQLDSVSRIASAQRYRHGEAYLALGGMQSRLAELDRLQRSFIITGDETVRLDMRAALDSAGKRLNEFRGAGYLTPSASISAWLDSLTAATRTLEQLVAAGEFEEASNHFEQVKPVFASAGAELRRLYQHVDDVSGEEVQTAARISARAVGTTVMALLICATIAFLFGAWTTRALTRPIMRLRDSMALVADGEFRVPENLPYERQDEIGSVSRSFRAMTRRLADLDRLKAEFMSISTHELKTPINVISGYAELMQEHVYGDLTEKQEEALLSIREQSRVLTQLVNQLLDVSRLEAGGMHLHMHDVAVRELFRRVERSFDALATKKKIELRVVVDAATPEHVPGDADRLADQVLGNLLSNALKFTPEGGRIEVRCWVHEGALCIEVEDSGPGIPADQLPFIFDKFFQVGDHARSKGAGLGLAIAQEVIAAHGGTIGASSEPGEGTTFRILLPTNGKIPEDAALVAPARQAAH